MKTQDTEGTNISRKTDNNEKVTLTLSIQSQSRSFGSIVPECQLIISESESKQFTISVHVF